MTLPEWLVVLGIPFCMMIVTGLVLALSSGRMQTKKGAGEPAP